MNRRELFKGLGAALVAASIPFPVETLVALPANDIRAYLLRLKLDLLNKITSPPCVMDEAGKITSMPTDVWQVALEHCTTLLKEFS